MGSLFLALGLINNCFVIVEWFVLKERYIRTCFEVSNPFRILLFVVAYSDMVLTLLFIAVYSAIIIVKAARLLTTEEIIKSFKRL
jgi:hypothetical protein